MMITSGDGEVASSQRRSEACERGAETGRQGLDAMRCVRQDDWGGIGDGFRWQCRAAWPVARWHGRSWLGGSDLTTYPSSPSSPTGGPGLRAETPTRLSERWEGERGARGARGAPG